MNAMKNNGTINRSTNKVVGLSKSANRETRVDTSRSDNPRLEMLTIWQVDPLTLKRELRTVLVPKSYCISKRVKPN